MIEEVLFSEEQLKKRAAELGAEISKDYEGKPILLIGILKGSLPFMADLMRRIDGDVEIDFMAVSSYGSSTVSSGVVKIIKDLDHSIEGKNVIVIGDIIDTGITLSYLSKYLTDKRPASLKVCTLLDKPSRREMEVKVDYVGFQIPDKFVLGYGLDFEQKYRNLPYIGVVEE